MKLFFPEDEWQRVRPVGFSKWLFRQCERYDSIGDLARDTLQDKLWLRRESRFIHFWMYLKHINAVEEYLDALVNAWEEWIGEKPPVPDSFIQEKRDGFYEGQGNVLSYGDSYQIAPNGMTYIYVLFEAETDIKPRKVKYVGQTIDPALRLKQHITQAGTIDKLLWVADLVRAGVFPKMGIIDLIDEKEATRLEKAYIYAFDESERKYGQPLGEALLNKLL